tara:strand:+ start:987 stop:1379 length:393 start_codon:yes stop_codon:yes gene_type:complete
MADTVSTQTLTDTTGVKFAVKMTNYSDGTGETLVKKVDASATTFMTEDGNRKISKIFYSINTANPKSAVELIWDGTDNATAVLLSGQGFWDLRADGNEITNNATTPTGDVLLSTKNFAIGDNYTILVVFR